MLNRVAWVGWEEEGHRKAFRAASTITWRTGSKPQIASVKKIDWLSPKAAVGGFVQSPFYFWFCLISSFSRWTCENESNVFRRGSICLVSVKVDQKQRPERSLLWAMNAVRSVYCAAEYLHADGAKWGRYTLRDEWSGGQWEVTWFSCAARHRLQLIKDCGVRLNPIKYDPLITPKAPCSKSIQNPSTSSAGHQLLHLHIYLYTHTRCIYIYKIYIKCCHDFVVMNIRHPTHLLG